MSRLGRQVDRIVASQTAVRVGLSSDGTLDDVGILSNWRKIEQHPDTGVAFAQQDVPAFSLAKSACMALHGKTRQFSLLGWDVAITDDDRIRIMEWNAAHPNIAFAEAAVGPCFHALTPDCAST